MNLCSFLVELCLFESVPLWVYLLWFKCIQSFLSVSHDHRVLILPHHLVNIWDESFCIRCLIVVLLRHSPHDIGLDWFMHVWVIYYIEIVVIIVLVVYTVECLCLLTRPPTGLALSSIWVLVSKVVLLFVHHGVKLLLMPWVVGGSDYLLWTEHLVMLVMLYTQVILCSYFRLRALYWLNIWFLFRVRVVSNMRRWSLQGHTIRVNVSWHSWIVLDHFHNSICWVLGSRWWS